MRVGFPCKWFRYSLFFSVFLSQLFLHSAESRQAEELISHVRQSIARAERGTSKLPSEVLSLHGYSSPKVRHFLNNLCSLPNTAYLEIGCWTGSTWISGLYDNYPNMSFAMAIDDWSQFDGAEQFHGNCNRFLGDYNYSFYSIDCFKIDLNSSFKQPITVYFYDGDHSSLAQELAFTYFNSILDELFIAVVDDWNWDDVKTGTRAAFDKMQYDILFEAELPASVNGDTENWWNGLYVAVISKPLQKGS